MHRPTQCIPRTRRFTARPAANDRASAVRTGGGASAGPLAGSAASYRSRALKVSHWFMSPEP
jgi:hypothetical protein